MQTLTVSEPDRLDRALVALVGSRSKAADALKAGRIRVDGVAVGITEASRELTVGTVLTLDEPGTHNSKKALIALRVLTEHGIGLVAEGRSWIAINKPAGLLTDAATFKQQREEPNATAIVTAYLEARHQPGIKALPAHRIDRDTSGVVLFATRTSAETVLRDQFAAHSPERTYLAAVHGKPTTDGGHWEHIMRWDPEQNRQLPARLDEPGAAVAHSDWRLVAHVKGAANEAGEDGHTSLLEVRLTTGRRNQIRLQAALSGHPLLGERLYHPPRGVLVPLTPANTPTPGRQVLHALALAFRDPDDGRAVTVSAPPPSDLEKLLRYFRWRFDAR